MYHVVISTPGLPDEILFPITIKEMDRRIGMMEDNQTVTITIVNA